MQSLQQQATRELGHIQQPLHLCSRTPTRAKIFPYYVPGLLFPGRGLRDRVKDIKELLKLGGVA